MPLPARGFCALVAAATIAAAGVGAATPSPPPEAARGPNLLLITLDTTRADHLGCYGDGQARTPVLGHLARSGVLFEEAHSHVPLTLPSHAVLMTGDLPSTLNLRVNGLNFKAGTATLASILKGRGYWTGAVVSSVILDRARGLNQGFMHYDDRMTVSSKPGAPPEERPGGEVSDAALAAVKSVKAPFFLWVHYYDAHFPYRPPEPYAKEFQGRPYDGEIAYMDASIGRLLDGLRSQGRLDDTLVVVAGDHGEGLMEHGERQHGVFLYEYALRVPLILNWTGHLPGGRRVPDLCGLADVAPTVLSLMAIHPPAKTDGESLVPLLNGGSLPSRCLYIESYHGFFTYGWAPLRGIMTDRWKFIEAPKPELYEWRKSETRNLYRPDAPEVAEARKELAHYPEADRGERAAMESLLKDPSNAETLRQLMSLGYLSGGGARPDTPGLLDPKDAIGIEEELREANDMMDLGNTREGTQKLLGVLKRNPQNVPALSMLGIAYMKAGQLDKAQVCFQEEIRLKPQMDTAHLNLGTVYKRTGRPELAEREYRAALALSPRMPEAVASLAQILLGQKRTAEARQVLEPALSAHVESADIYFEKGVLEAMTQNWEAARFAFTKVLTLDPRRDEAMANLGRIAYQQGRVDEAIAQYERALRLAPQNVEYLATVGSLYLNGKNDQGHALRYFQRALAADPYGPRAKDLREMVRALQAAGGD